MRRRPVFLCAGLLGLGACGQGDDPGWERRAGANKTLRFLPGEPRHLQPEPIGALPELRGMRLDGGAVSADEGWFAQVQGVATGAIFTPPGQARAFDARYTYLGLRPEANSFATRGAFSARYLREARLGSEAPRWVLSSLAEMPHIDCLVVTTIRRETHAEPYLYGTLRSTFDSFPAGLQVNLAVGSSEVDYVRPERLAAALGAERAARVHVFPPTDEEAAYLRAHFGLFKRGGWNYSRGLLGYHGERGLLMVEDDITWTKGGGALVNGLAQQTNLPLISAYNGHCQDLEGRTRRASFADVALETSGHPNKFQWGLQALYIAPYVARPLGRYMLLRLDHPRVWDALVGFFVMEHDLDVGYAFPSLVQHMGKMSTGCTPWEHQSRCFRDEIAPSSYAPGPGAGPP